MMQEVPTAFVRQGTEPSFILISLCHVVTTVQPQLVLPWIKEWPCLVLLVNFWHRASLLLPRRSLLTVRGNLGKKKSKRGSWKTGDLILLSCIRTNCYVMHPEVVFVAVARPLRCFSPTSAAYIHPMHCRSCCYYFSVPHKTAERWEVLHE